MSHFLHDNDTETFNATVATTRGLIVQCPSTKVGIAVGPAEIGEQVTANTRGRVEIPNPDSVAFAAGAAVGYDQTADKATAAAGGTFDVGAAADTYAGTEGYVVAYLNE